MPVREPRPHFPDSPEGPDGSWPRTYVECPGLQRQSVHRHHSLLPTHDAVRWGAPTIAEAELQQTASGTYRAPIRRCERQPAVAGASRAGPEDDTIGPLPARRAVIGTHDTPLSRDCSWSVLLLPRPPPGEGQDCSPGAGPKQTSPSGGGELPRAATGRSPWLRARL